MIHFIENEHLKVGVKEFGCEITSIYSKEADFEYLWQGNPDVWSGQSPILFPIIGRLIEDKFTLNGKEYEMPKHGFARKLPWKFISKSNDSMVFVLQENKETLKAFPFSFELKVTYTLIDNKLSVCHEVNNKSTDTMYFSLGAHPAFNCEIGDKLIFDKNETLDTIKIDLVNSLRLPETTPLLRNENTITVTEDIFKEDALIMKGAKSENITLTSDKHNRKVKFSLGKAPYLGIWAKPGAPYVCIEPWFGVNDALGKKVDFSEKEGIISLDANEKFVFIWSAEFTA